MKYTIKHFIDELSSVRLNKSAINHYSFNYDLAKGFTTQMNLLFYLTTMQKEIKPKTLLLGEAPGHKGCTLTGVPFTSEAIIGSGKIKIFSYSPSSKYLIQKERIKLQKENTASIVWETLEKLDAYPLLWNAFPFSPVHPNTMSPNRKPSGAEILKYGKPYFQKLMQLFSIKHFIAVGKTAERAFEIFGINYFESVRHPSYGGKSVFVSGLMRLSKIKYL